MTTFLLCGLFFLSGVAALLFETLWFRQAGLAFGNDVWASSLVLSSFMAGLALGNGLAARLAGALRAPLRAYAALELAIGVAGVALVLRIDALAPVLVPLLQPFLDSPWLQNPIRLALAFALLLVPATAMGATLPVMVAALRRRDPSFGGALGRLYGWNTLGAVLGAIAGELWLVGALGVTGSALAAATCNAVAALGALWLARRTEPVAGALPTGPAARLPAEAWPRLAAAFLAGGLLLALEVVWFRFLHLFVHSGSAAFAWMLAVVLAGIASGGLLGGRWLRARDEAWRAAPGVALLSGALTASLYAGFHLTSRSVAGVGHASPLATGGLVAVLAFPVALLSGVLFVLLGAGLARSVAPETRATGWLTLANTIGSALGSLVAGFGLLPEVGMERSFAALAASYGLVAWLARPAPLARPSAAGGLLLAAFALALGLFPFGRMERVFLRAPIDRWHAGHEHVVLARSEGRTETAAIVERRLAGQRLSTFLVTDSFSMSSTAAFARRYMKLYVYWPVALRPDPESALLISYGVGSTASALVATASLERIDVVDVSREILALSGVIHSDPTRDPLRDPRVHVHVEDGRYYLQMTPRRYDLITSEPPPPKNAGIVNLYTREYFALIRDRLRRGGVATYWLPVHNLLESDAKAIARAFCDVFEDCALWVGHDLDWMLTGSRAGLTRPGEEAFTRQWRDPRVVPELVKLGLEQPEALGTTFLGDAAWIADWTAGVAPLVDDWPKRLSHRLQRRGRAVFGPLMDADETARRFRESAWIASVWPESLRARTLAHFDAQEAVNRAARGAPGPWPLRLRTVDRLLEEPARPTVAMWQLGVTADVVDAVEAALREGADPAPHRRVLAIRALVRRDFAGAAQEFARARARAPDDAGLLLLELYARCRAGQVEAASGIVARVSGQLAPDPQIRRSLRWLARAHGLRLP